MSDKRKTKAQLIDELTELRQRVAQLEQVEPELIHPNGSQQPDPPRRDQLLFDTLIKYLPDYVYFKDAQGRIILSNASDEQSRAGERTSITSDNISSKLQLSDHQQLPDTEIIRTGVPVLNAETVVVDDNGSERWILNTRAPVVNEADEVIGLLGIERDITADKLRIIELQHRMQEMASVHQQTIVYAKDLAREISEHKETTQELQRQIEQKELAHQQSIIYAKELREEIVERKRVEAELNLYKEYLEERAEQLAVLHQLDQAITASLHINNIYDALAHQVQRLLPYDRIAIAILNDEYMQMTYVTGVGNTATPAGTMFPAETSALGAVVKSGALLVRQNLVKEPGFVEDEIMVAEGVRSAIILPLWAKGQVIGAWELASCQIGAYDDSHQEFAVSIASQLSIAIENAKLYDETHQQAAELTSLNMIAQAINSTLSLQKTLTLITDHMLELLGVEAASVALYDQAENELWFAATSGGGISQILGERLAIGQGVVGWVAENSQPALVPDTSLDARYAHLSETYSNYQTRSMVCVPLQTKGKTIGTIQAMNKIEGHFNQGDLNRLSLLAAPAAIAIENARLHERLQEQLERLRQSQAQLIQIEKMAALGRLVASIAHEINNPLQSVRSCLTLVEEVMVEIREGGEINKYLDIAGEEIERIAMIVSRMRDFYRPVQQLGQLPNSETMEDIYYSIRDQSQQVDLHAVLESVLSLANKQLYQNGVRVESRWSPDLPLIQGNADYLKQVFLNLVLNAIDAMVEKGNLIQVRTSQTIMETQGKKDQAAICIEFEDDGVGMSLDTLSRVFEPLYTTKEDGSGFGLYTSYKIIEAHGGQIHVDSSRKKGTQFTILLPVEQV